MTKSLLYGDLNDADLDLKIQELRAAYEKAVNGGVAVVAGEGRRLEYSRANLGGLEGLLKQATREKDSRAGVQISGGLSVAFPYGDGGYHG